MVAGLATAAAPQLAFERARRAFNGGDAAHEHFDFAA